MDLESYPVPLRFVYKKQQNCDKDQCSFIRFLASKCSHHVPIFHETFLVAYGESDF